MNLLLFSDLHADTAAAKRLVELARTADVLIGAGDFGVMRRRVRDCIDVLCDVDKPAILVPGNGESVEELTEAARVWPSARVLHGSGVTVNGVEFFGIGGGIPVTPYGSWSYDFSEEQATAMLANCPIGGILVSHSPPKGVLDVTNRGEHIGSTAVLATIERCRPKLVVCGHVHNCWTQREMIGTSLVINAGPGGIELAV